MSYKRVETLRDAVRHAMLLEIICKGCSRVRRVSPGALLGRRLFNVGVTLGAVGERMRCRGKDLEGGGCGHRGAIVRPIFEPTPNDDGPPSGGGATVVPFPLEQRGEVPAERRRRRA